MKQPPVTFFLKKAAGIKSGSKTTGRGFVGKVTRDQIREIAEKKRADLNSHSVEAAMAHDRRLRQVHRPGSCGVSHERQAYYESPRGH